jgi:5-formyltetrahydrofolate cyclo-ligase
MLKLDAFQRAQRIAMYLANDGEIDTREVIDRCYQEDKQAFLPVVQQSEGRNWLLFGALTPETKFEPNSLGIAEPVLDRQSLLPADALDLVLVPLVGFDNRGSRVGMGGGFYDTTFEFLHKNQVNRPRLVGVAHEIQRVERIEVESWDIPLPIVVTDRSIYRFEP